MADGTKIEWAEATANYVNGCSLTSPGCTNCYAMRLAGTRLKNVPSRAGLTHDSKAGPVWTGEVRENPKVLEQVLGWKRPRAIFWNAHGDLFHENVPDEWIDKQFAVMALTPQHRHMVLTKRSARMREYFSEYFRNRIDCEIDAIIAERVDPLHRRSDDLRAIAPDLHETWPLPNVWLGVSVEDQRRANELIPDLLATPAAIRFISAEPLLGPVDLESAWHGENALDSECWGECNWCRNGSNFPPLHNCQEHRQPESEWDKGRSGLDWVIVGGESGPGARPMHPDWARGLRDQCEAAGVAFHFKQWGAWLPWEPEHGPCWKAQNGQSEDHHALFPVDIDADPNWDDGLWAVDDCEHFAFQRVGKKRAGRLLDGVEHNGMPIDA